MSIGAKTAIDKKLIQLYAEKQTMQFNESDRIDPEMVWQGMKIIASTNRTFINLSCRKN
jgi:hypothetical protein